MQSSRRSLLAATATACLSGLAGCSVFGSGTGEEPHDGASGTNSAPAEESSAEAGGSVEVAVAAEWNAMRARLRDALSLGLAGDVGAGAAVARHTFARFEEASGEYGAHETLEATSEAAYEEFEEALGELRTEGLQARDLDRGREEVDIATAQLADAQRTLVGDGTVRLLDLQSFGSTARNAAFLAAAGAFEAARTTAERLSRRVEESDVRDALEAADAEASEAFEAAVDSLASATEQADAEAVRTAADEASRAAIDGSYTLADDRTTAAVGHLAVLQARGWDAAALAGSGGPPPAFAHAAALTIYRARIRDARWLAARGETERAASMAGDVFAHFENARAHEALEGADDEAYEGFEAGLSALRTAIDEGDAGAIDDAVGTIDSNLVAGIEALAGPNAPLLAAAFFRARLADARERYRLGRPAAAAGIAEAVFERFERNELDVHETVEATSQDLYTRFEDEHLRGLIDAFEAEDDEAVETHYEGVRDTLLAFETAEGSTATVGGAEAATVAARGFDAAVLDALGDDERAGEIAREAYEHFESGAGGYHGALEAADPSIYETFERRLGALSAAASDGDDVYAAATAFNDETVASIYAVVGTAGGERTDAAVAILEDVFASFEEARVHDTLSAADHNAYATFEAALDAYLAVLAEGGDATAAADSFARAALYAQFALTDSVEQLPLDLDLAGTSAVDAGTGHESEADPDLEGGPNVVDGVPEDADHVVDMTAVAFEPADLTVSRGDTVAWTFAGGEPHSVTAYQEKLPDGAAYWASGGFESQPAAETGWENGSGAVRSGQSYVHTFETAGTHEYYCIPHEAAGMVGTVTVE